MPGGTVRPRTNADKDRESGLGIRTCNETNNLMYMSTSFGIDSYYPPAVNQPSNSEESLHSLDAAPEPPRDSTPNHNSSRESSYYTAYSPETVLNNALRELEPVFERHDSKAAASTRMSTPELPANLLQPIDKEEKSARHEDIEFHQAVKNQLNAMKSDITRLAEELSAHKRSAAVQRADIRTDIRSTKIEQTNSATDLHSLLSKITEKVSKLENLTAEAGHGRNNSTVGSSIQASTDPNGISDHSNEQSSKTGDTPTGTITEIQQQIAALQYMDRDIDLKLKKIQQSLSTIQACFEGRLLEKEKDVNYPKRKHIIDTLDIDKLKRRLPTQNRINTILIDTIISMEQKLGQSSSQTAQLQALNYQLNLRYEE
ncbi:unnamed protein product [Clonostachys byssicola]|uniref:Uncharacterized protein n=1 Tax=Clonostachys byssicola TaxID=160290 RepID=A0A9N9Y5H4_9HYPO|nr:unnamed protein product [Clonostachys byssicola]